MTTETITPATTEAVEHLRACRVEHISPLGAAVAGIIGAIKGGLHNYRGASEIDWSRNDYVEVRWDGELATYDFSNLTRLVFLAHDACVRVSISPRSHRSLTLLFHQRQREGGIWQRHPTLENAVAEHRTHYLEGYSAEASRARVDLPGMPL
jgi:hypothetical protein